MEDKSKQFTMKPAVAAMSGIIIVVLGALLSFKNINGVLSWSIFFASISLPALTALPMLDSYRKNNRIITAAYGFAAFFGLGGFFMFISSLIFYYSKLSGFCFIITGVIWLVILLKFKNNDDDLKNS